MMIASSLQDADETVELLIKKGADVNSKSRFFPLFFSPLKTMETQQYFQYHFMLTA